MATTPGGLPYPLPTDPVAGAADAIKALALAMDPTVKPVWKAITPAANFAALSSGCHYALLGNGQVALRGGVSLTTGGPLNSGSIPLVVPLPVEARPPANVGFNFPVYNSTVIGSGLISRLNITSSGNFNLYVNATTPLNNGANITWDGITYWTTPTV